MKLFEVTTGWCEDDFRTDPVFPLLALAWISLSALLEPLLPPPPFSTFRAERLQSFKFLQQFS